MTKDPAAPRASQARRGPLQRGRRTPRGWAIDTTPLRNRAYRRLFGGVAATMLGQQMTLVAVPYQVYQLTGSSLLVGVTSIVALVPLIVFGLLGGAIADAMDRRTADADHLDRRGGDQRAAGRAGAAARRRAPGGAVGADRLRLRRSPRSTSRPAARSSRRSSARRASPAANALAMTVRQAGVIVGPLLAGLLIGLGDLFLAYTVDAVGLPRRGAAAARAAAVAAGARSPDRLRLGAAVRGVGEGFAFLRTQPVLLMTFVVDIIAMTVRAGRRRCSRSSRRPGSRSREQPGLAVRRGLDRRAGDGADVGLGDPGRPAGRRRARRDRGRGALAIIGFGLAPALWLAVLCLAVAGAADMVSAVLRTSMLQIAAPEEMRGRMQGVFIVVVAGGPRLGDLRAGALASATSVSPSRWSPGAW